MRFYFLTLLFVTFGLTGCAVFQKRPTPVVQIHEVRQLVSGADGNWYGWGRLKSNDEPLVVFRVAKDSWSVERIVDAPKGMAEMHLDPRDGGIFVSGEQSGKSFIGILDVAKAEMRQLHPTTVAWGFADFSALPRYYLVLDQSKSTNTVRAVDLYGKSDVVYATDIPRKAKVLVSRFARFIVWQDGNTVRVVDRRTKQRYGLSPLGELKKILFFEPDFPVLGILASYSNGDTVCEGLDLRGSGHVTYFTSKNPKLWCDFNLATRALLAVDGTVATAIPISEGAEPQPIWGLRKDPVRYEFPGVVQKIEATRLGDLLVYVEGNSGELVVYEWSLKRGRVRQAFKVVRELGVGLH